MSSRAKADWHDGFALELLDKDHKNYKWSSEKMQDTIAKHVWGTFSGYEIVNVYRVKNSNLYEKYRERREEIHSETGEWVKEVRLFHGTTHAREIVENGFRAELASKGSMFGQGIYFSDRSSKSNQYTFEGFRKPCKKHSEVLCQNCVRTMLLCKVAFGKEYHTDSEMKNITEPPKGYHSVIGDAGKNLYFDEYVIYNNYQAYPGHLIEYKVRK